MSTLTKGGRPATKDGSTQPAAQELPSARYNTFWTAIIAQPLFAVVLITLLAFGLRAYAYWWGYPYSLHVDEYFDFSMVRRMARLWNSSRSLNINSSQYGALSYYLLWIINIVLGWIKPGLSLVYEGRVFSALCGALTTPLIYWIGARLYNRWTGIIAAAFYAVMPIAVQYAHFYTPDSLLMLEISLTLATCVRLMAKESWTNYLLMALAVGLTLATKPTGLALAGPIAVAILKHLWPMIQNYKLQVTNYKFKEEILPRLGRLAVCGLVVVAVFIVVNPYSVTDAEHYWGYNKNDDLRVQLDVVSGRNQVIYASQFAGSIPYLYHLTRTLPYGLGPLLEILSVAGVLYSLYRAFKGNWSDWLILAWVLPLFFTVGGAYIKFVRYLLPILPFAGILAARLLVDGYGRRRTTEDSAKPRGALLAWTKEHEGLEMEADHLSPITRHAVLRTSSLVVALGTLTFATTLFWTLAMNSLLSRPDARVQAIDWMLNNIPAGATMLIEKDGALRLDDMRGRYNLDPDRWQVSVLDLYEIDGVKSVLYMPPAVDPQRKAAYLRSKLGPEWIVISDNWPDSFMPLAEYYPVEAEYYRQLLNGEFGYQIVKQFKEYPGLLGLSINDDHSELTWRIYDHPRVYILRKQS